jgi:hypothetical protein
LSPAVVVRTLKLGLTELADVNLRVQDRLAENRDNDSIWTTDSPLNVEEARVFTTVVFQAKAELNRDSIPGTPARYGTTRAAFHRALSDGMQFDDVPPVNLIASVNQAMLNMRNGLRSLPEEIPLRNNTRVDAINREISRAIDPTPYLNKFGADLDLVNSIANPRFRTDMQRDVVIAYRREICTYAWLLSQNPLSVLSLAQQILDNQWGDLIPRANDILERHRFVLHGRPVPPIPDSYPVLRGLTANSTANSTARLFFCSCSVWQR